MIKNIKINNYNELKCCDISIEIDGAVIRHNNFIKELTDLIAKYEQTLR